LVTFPALLLLQYLRISFFDKLLQPVLTYNAEISVMDSYLTYYRAERRAEISNKEIDNFTFIDKTENKTF
jgi:hypothetical protein